MDKKTLYLIDGYAFAYRAHYALIRSPLINSKGFPTSAAYGFTNYLLRLIEAYGCPYIAVVMDSGKPTFRHEAYPDYKANREAMPDDLKMQIPRIIELLDAFNIPVISRDGFEADDIIASITHKAVAEGFEVFLMTKDKDLMQLVGPKVRMIAPEGYGAFQIMGPKEVYDKMRVRPERILDYLALVGDTSDNIPGVPGIGMKGAAKILETTTVDQILENPSLVGTPRLAAMVESNKEQLIMSKMLATLRIDVDLGFEMDYLKRRDFNLLRCQELLTELEFNSMLRNPLFGGGTKFQPAVRLVDSIELLRELVDKIKTVGEVSVDAEIAGRLPRGAELTGMALAVGSAEAFYIRFDGGKLDKQETLKILAEVIESPQIGKIGHDLKLISHALRGEGLTMRGIAFDTLLAAYIIDPGKRQHELSELVHEQLGFEIKTNSLSARKDDSAIDLLADEINTGAANAACASLLLRDKFKASLSERNSISLFCDIELSLQPILADLEWNGVLIDTALLSRMSPEYASELEQITREIYEFAGEEFNINSPKQLSEILFGKLGLHGGKKTKSGALSTGVEVLEKLAVDYPVVQKILDYREKQKLLSTYIDALPAQIFPETRRIHTTFNQAITATGRLSSTNPNLQNIPIRTEAGKKIREAFIAPAGSVLVSADYSQIELRILAHLSGDPMLIQAFVDDKDIHTETASAVYGIFPEMVTPEMRRAAKTINFGLMYGMGPMNLSKQLGVSFAEAKDFIESYFNQFPSIRKYMDTTIQGTRDHGYSETLLGRRRYLSEINSTSRIVREAAERTAINTPVQGTAADIIKLAMIRVYPKLEQWPGVKMLLQIHDELVFEVPEEQAGDFAKWVSKEMSEAYELKVPLKVDTGTGKHWGEAH
ncbi:MAG: DNA polymerase I [Chitinispirillales bacterium]|jgi:DNA polymerase-1|nr:DNA polymerase I [Chitinispirillales bacterium]